MNYDVEIRQCLICTIYIIYNKIFVMQSCSHEVTFTLKEFYSLLLTPYSSLISHLSSLVTRLFLPAQLNQCLFQRFFRPDEIVFPPELLIIRTQLVGKKFIQPGSFS